MKILQIHTNSNGLLKENGSPKGGLEKVILDSHYTFLEYGINSIVIDDILSSTNESDGFKKFDLSSVGYKKSKPLILDFVQTEKPDLIVVHGSNKMVKPLTENGLRFLFIDHQPHTSISLLYHNRLFNQDSFDAKLNGSLFYSVSESSKNMKETRINTSINPNFKFDGFIKFQHTTEELSKIKTVDHKGYFVTVGRCSGKDKSPHKIIKYCKSKNIPYKIITMGVDKDEDTKEYYKKWFSDKEDCVYVDISRDKVLEIISNAAAYVSTCEFESAGITAFESLSLGVPLILFENKNYSHSSKMFAEKFSKDIITTNDDPTLFLNYSIEERIKIRNRCETFNSKKLFIDSILEVSSMIKPNKYKNPSISIENFF